MAGYSYADVDYVFKMILVGDSGVGKSSLLLRYADEVFQDSFICTIGVDLRIRNVKVKDKMVKLHIWDTAGQERFKTVCSHYYRGAEAVVFVYDITDQLSFDHIRTWYQEVKMYCREDCVFLLIGNKSDLVAEKVVSTEQAQELATAMNMQHVETSAKNRTNVEHLFTTVTSELVDKHGGKSKLEVGTSDGLIDSSGFRTSRPVKGGRWVSLNCFDCSIM